MEHHSLPRARRGARLGLSGVRRAAVVLPERVRAEVPPGGRRVQHAERRRLLRLPRAARDDDRPDSRAGVRPGAARGAADRREDGLAHSSGGLPRPQGVDREAAHRPAVLRRDAGGAPRGGERARQAHRRRDAALLRQAAATAVHGEADPRRDRARHHDRVLRRWLAGGRAPRHLLGEHEQARPAPALRAARAHRARGGAGPPPADRPRAGDGPAPSGATASPSPPSPRAGASTPSASARRWGCTTRRRRSWAT